jgi:hypothetical protein
MTLRTVMLLELNMTVRAITILRRARASDRPCRASQQGWYLHKLLSACNAIRPCQPTGHQPPPSGT